ncbi:hypothetical protein EYF80_026558 [Liparis tanakae]|uniref:Uncharacterized protein n=1 Tax=Liparis tanakae TaxID=230148 RepID=A0A4Z2HD78_9TELE|nr:hypothetical protein EYF80_026558 [Liparis tanakae]
MRFICALPTCVPDSNLLKVTDAQKRWREERGLMKDVVASKLPGGELDDAKTKYTATGPTAKERRKERASEMCLTAGVCVAVMGDPAGPRAKETMRHAQPAGLGPFRRSDDVDPFVSEAPPSDTR